MTKTQKVVGIAVATAVTIFTYTSYNGNQGKIIMQGTAGQASQAAVPAGTSNVSAKKETTTSNPTNHSKHTPGYSNPISDN